MQYTGIANDCNVKEKKVLSAGVICVSFSTFW